MMLPDHIENAYRTLIRNRARSVLTTIGITIGVASVITILALSSGVARVIDRQVEALDGNLIIVRPGTDNTDPNSITNQITQQSFRTSSLTEADVKSILTLPGVEAAAPVMTIEGTLTAGKTSRERSVVLATTPSFEKVSLHNVLNGQFIDDVTDRDTAVLGEQLAIDLFGTNQPIGQTFSLREQRFTVIGILKRTQDPINYNNIDFDRAAIISLDTGKTFNQGRSQIQQINIRAKSTDLIPGLTASIRSEVQKNHLGENDFTVISGNDIGAPTSQVFHALTNVMAAIAAISLFVGGIGIMNIMLVGVAERTREIGIRKAVGASNRMIIMQFLIESLLISMLGGGLGYILGYVVAFIISTFLFFAPAFTWMTAGAALLMSVSIGLAFGLYPALRAARKDTIESLRQYH